MRSNFAPGLGDQSAYMVAGRPYLTGDTLAAAGEDEVVFPMVTRSLTVLNTGGANAIRVHFDSQDNGNTIANHHFITLAAGAGMTFDVKCRSVFVSSVLGSTYEVFAELTPCDDEYNLAAAGTEGIND